MSEETPDPRGRAYRLQAVRVPIMRATGLTFILACLAVHNGLLLGWQSARLVLPLAFGLAGYTAISFLVLQAYYRKPERESRNGVGWIFLLADGVIIAGVIYLSGGERSWLFFLLLLPVLTHSHLSAKRAVIQSLWTLVAYGGMLLYIRFADGLPVSWGTGFSKALLIMIAETYCILIAFMAERNRRRIADALREAKAQAESRAAQLTALNRLTQTAAGELDLDSMLATVTKEMVSLFRASSSGIALMDDERRFLRVAAYHSIHPQEHEVVGTKIPLAANPSAQQVVETGRPLVITDAQNTDLTTPMHPVMRQLGIHSMMLAPLRSYGEVIGTIGIDTDDPERTFTQEEVLLAETIAGEISGPVGNARLYVEEKRSHELAERLHLVAAAISESLELETVLTQILEQLEQVIAYDSGSVQMIEEDGMRVIAVRGLPGSELGRVRPLASHPYNRRLATSREPLLISLPRDAELWFGMEELPRVRTVLGVPLVVRDQIIGAMSIDSHRDAAYTWRDAGAAMAFAQHAAIAIDNARLYASLTESNKQLVELSVRDPLTGVANRRKFEETLATEWQRARRAQTPVALVMIDVDSFKAYNDTYGHQSGDLVLQRVSDALRTGVRRAGDLVARFGGEEFVVLLPATDLRHALTTADDIRRSVESLALPHSGSAAGLVTISAGVASIVPTTDDASALVAIADQQLYEAKRSGRNRVMPFPIKAAVGP